MDEELQTNLLEGDLPDSDEPLESDFTVPELQPSQPFELNKQPIWTVSPLVILAATSVIRPNAGVMNVTATVSGGAVVLTSNPSIADGINGQVLVLRGTSDSDTVTLTAGNGMRMSSDMILAANDTIMFYFDGLVTNDWVEIGRNVDVFYPDGSIVGTFTSYEALTTGDAVALVAPDTTDQTYSELSQDADLAIGDDAARTYVAQGFKAGATTYINKVDLYLKKTGSPSGDLTVHIYSGTTTPSISLGSATILTADIGTSYAYETASFNNPIPLTSGNQYFIVLTRTAAVNASNYFIVGVDNSSSSYGTSNDVRFVGSAVPAWTATTTSDLIFKTYKEDTTATAQVRKTRGTSGLLTNNFIGFANSSVSAAASVVITRFPSKSSLSSIIPGRAHYISDTAGAISSSAGTNILRVAIGKSTTAIELGSIPTANNKRLHSFVTDVQVSNTITETSLISFTLPGGSLGTSSVVYVRINLSSMATQGAGTVNLKCYYGETSIDLYNFTGSGSDQFPGYIDFYIYANAATSAQVLTAYNWGSEVSAAAPSTNRLQIWRNTTGTAAIDSNQDQTVKVTFTAAVADAATVINATDGFAVLYGA